MSPRVALLGRDDAVRAQLRQAVIELGARVVFEGELCGADQAHIAAAEPEVLLINLDANGEDALDRIEPLLADPQINVVFNEAEITSQLSGWDLARWARHLAAKVLGHREITPPPPPGASLLPSRDLQLDMIPLARPAPPPPSQAMEKIAAEVRVLQSDVPASQTLVVERSAPILLEKTAVPEFADLAHDLGPVGIDLGAIESAMQGGSGKTPAVEKAAPLPQAAGARPAAPDEPTVTLDLGEIEASLAAIGQAMPVTRSSSPMSTRKAPDAPTTELDLGDIEAGLAALGQSMPKPASPSPKSTTTSPALDFGGLDLPTDDLGLEPITLEGADDGVPANELRIEGLEGLDDDLSMGGGTAINLEGLETSIDLGAPTGSIRLEGLETPLDLGAPAGTPMQLEGLGGDLDLDGVATHISIEGLEAHDLDAPATALGSVSLTRGGADIEPMDLEGDAAVAALAAQLEALEASSAPRGEQVQGLDFSLLLDTHEADEKPAAQAPRPAAPAAARPTAPAKPAAGAPARPEPPAREAPRKIEPKSGGGLSFNDLSLSPIDDPGLLVPGRKSTPLEPPPTPRRDLSSVGLSLSLEPIAKDSDPAKAFEDRPKPQVHAAVAPGRAAGGGLSLEADERAELFPRVIVLGASIGGPDALRTFLGGIPEGFPALFLLAQHLENGFFSRLAQQLQKASKLPVRVANDGAGAAARSQVIVVPSDARFAVKRDGSIIQSPHPAPPHYKPCIDDLFRAAADEFGKRVTAIIFSGMAGDAIEGAVYVTAKGGEVWAQDPQSCVVSSMVDGARSRGVVEFSGSPRELAEQAVARYGKGN